MPHPKYDVAVFGATSFAGRLLAAYLAEHFNGVSEKLSWALAGRSEAKLAELKGPRESLSPVPEGSRIHSAPAEREPPRVRSRLRRMDRALRDGHGQHEDRPSLERALRQYLRRWVQAAASIALDHHSGGKKSGKPGGFWTPATMFDESLIDRLVRHAGITFGPERLRSGRRR